MIRYLYYGDYAPSEKDFSCDKKYQEAKKKYNQIIEETIQLLQNHNIKNAENILDQIIDSWIDIHEYDCLHAFESGIELGLGITKIKKKI